MGKDGELRMLEEEGFSASGRHSAVRSYLCLTDQRRGGACIRASNSSAHSRAKQSRAGKQKQVRMLQLRRRYIVCEVEVRVAHVTKSSPGQESE